jgi:plasmid stabilization system protein ParE
VSLPIDVAFLAGGDVQEHAAFVGRFNSEVALRFIRAATETYQYLAEFPGSGTFYEIEDPSIPA